ncbi:ABC transporter ATP-binding protein [Chitinibacter tainanensis]|uniref:ABC transporter ATP-binding protein n=1 Tax=Chitinibacter tainanensis TaxID=230667 RepID=UPI000418A2AE|nr:ABC transporter ATP-binding protein [Chitinibacter tainanensis]
MLTDIFPSPLPNRPRAFVLAMIKPFLAWYALMLVLEAGAATCTMLLPYILGKTVAQVTGAQAADPHWHGLVQLVLVFAALNVAELVLSRAAGAVQMHVGPRQRHRITARLFAWLQYHSHRYFAQQFSGALAHRVTETAMSVNQTIWAVHTEFWPILVTFCVASFLLWGASPVLAGVLLSWIILYVTMSYVLARKAQPLAQRFAAARSYTAGKIVDSVSNLANVRLFAQEAFERDYLQRHLDEELIHANRSNWYTERVRWYQFGSAMLLKIGMLAFALYLWAQGQIGVAAFVMSTSMSLLIIGEARNLSRRFLEVFEYLGNIEHGVHTIVRPHEISDQHDARPHPIRDGQIEFRQVEFAYQPGRPVFQGLNLTIPPGQRVGVVGYSGSGKSTLISLLLRWYDVQQGDILLDGVPITQMQLATLHQQISMIPQEPSLFHRSLKENIRYARPEASDAEVIEAARQAHAHEFIARLPQGYDTMVGERGVSLSGGQRQRLAIARAMLQNAPVLILDEATSALDSQTERWIQHSLDNLMANKTVLVVAHRLSTIAHLDRILVFAQGEIVEDGAHAELLAQGGVYAQLWAHQSGGLSPEQAPTGELALAHD